MVIDFEDRGVWGDVHSLLCVAHSLMLRVPRDDRGRRICDAVFEAGQDLYDMLRVDEPCPE